MTHMLLTAALSLMSLGSADKSGEPYGKIGLGTNYDTSFWILTDWCSFPQEQLDLGSTRSLSAELSYEILRYN